MRSGPIEGQVIAILGDREVLLDRGIKHGVEIGMRFVILDETMTVRVPGTEVEVPVHLPKTIVKIVRYEGDIASVGRTFRTVKGFSGFALTSSPDRPETFAYDDEVGITSARDKVVRVGDPVRETKGSEYFDGDV